MNICFIGSNGFMAQTFGAFYNSANIHVIGRTRPSYKFATFTQIDLLKDKIDIDLISCCDLIFYFAGEGVQSNLPTSAENIYKINTFIPIELITTLNEKGYEGTFITFGSYAEIGSNKMFTSFTEEAILNSSLLVPNDYTVSKRLLSKFVDAYPSKFRTLHFIVPTIYGKNENKNRLIPYLLNCKKENKTIQLTSGDQIRQYLFIEDLPLIIDKTISLNIEHGIYNIAGPDVLSVKDIVEIVANICNITKNNIQFNTAQRWDTTMHTLILDGSKLEKCIQYKASSRIETTIQSYL